MTWIPICLFKSGNMKSVFDMRPVGKNRFTDELHVRNIILMALDKTEWVSTSDLYVACQSRVKRKVLHEALKSLLFEKVIRMRVVNRAKSVMPGSSKTEFKRS